MFILQIVFSFFAWFFKVFKAPCDRTFECFVSESLGAERTESYAGKAVEAFICIDLSRVSGVDSSDRAVDGAHTTADTAVGGFGAVGGCRFFFPYTGGCREWLPFRAA